MSVQNAMESSETQEILPGLKELFLPLFSRPKLNMASLSVSGDNRSLLPVTGEVGSDEYLVSYVAVPASSVQESRIVQDVQQSIRVTANESVEREAATRTDENTDGPFGCSSAVTSKVRPALELPEQQPLVTSQHQLVEQVSHVMSSIRNLHWISNVLPGRRPCPAAGNWLPLYARLYSFCCCC